jgi:hypothetical protein
MQVYKVFRVASNHGYSHGDMFVGADTKQEVYDIVNEYVEKDDYCFGDFDSEFMEVYSDEYQEKHNVTYVEEIPDMFTTKYGVIYNNISRE